MAKMKRSTRQIRKIIGRAGRREQGDSVVSLHLNSTFLNRKDEDSADGFGV